MLSACVCWCVYVCVRWGGVGYGTYENVCVEGGGVVLLTKLPFLSVRVHNFFFLISGFMIRVIFF